jgi:hypothetical protein
MNIETSEWTDCYGEGWGDDLVPAAYSHPAKASKALIFRIVQHCLDQGWLRAGQTCLEPFGGIGTTALPCLLKGINVVSCELEKAFYDLQGENAALWQRRYGAWPAFQAARWTRLNGDSRKLAQLVREADVSIASPPYADSINSSQSGIDWDKAKRPERWGKSETRNGCQADGKHQMKYGESEGQLGAMKEGDLSAAISSPPFIQQYTSVGGINVKGYGAEPRSKETAISASSADQLTCSKSITKKTRARQVESGTTQSKISKHCAYPVTEKRHDVTGSGELFARSAELGSSTSAQEFQRVHQNASESPSCKHSGDTTRSAPNTFWESARQIVEQTFLLLRPGGHAIWICKNFVRKGQEVDFNGNWRRLCESVGFQTVCIHHAMLVENRGTNLLLEGGEHTDVRERKSFFRRLHEKRPGAVKIYFEQVTCMVKP